MFAITLYVLTFPALLVLLVSAVVRANDIGDHPIAMIDNHRHGKWFWGVRRLGLSLVAGSAAGWLLWPLWLWHDSWLYFSCAFMMLWGFTMTWLTTPNQPPWWRYVTGYFEGHHR